MTTGTLASPRRPPGPAASPGTGWIGAAAWGPRRQGGQLSAPSPVRRARSQSREEQAVLLVRRAETGQHSWVPRGRDSVGVRAEAASTLPGAPTALQLPGSPAAPVLELSTIPASVFPHTLQLDPKQEQQLFQRLEEES